MMLTTEQAASIHLGVCVLIVSDPEPWRGNDGIVPLYTECPSPYCDGNGGDKDQPGWRCPNFCNKARVLVGRGSIEVVPVVAQHDPEPPAPYLVVLPNNVWLIGKTEPTVIGLDPLPVPGRDFGIIIDCVEVA